jgi:hypothetical protein
LALWEGKVSGRRGRALQGAMSQYRYIHKDGRACEWLPSGRGSYHAICAALGDVEANDLLGLDAETCEMKSDGGYKFDAEHKAEVLLMRSTKDGSILGRVLRK